MDAASNAFNSLEEHTKQCSLLSDYLQENVVLPNKLVYNPEANSLVESIQSELADLKVAFRQLHDLAIEHHSYITAVKVVACFYSRQILL